MNKAEKGAGHHRRGLAVLGGLLAVGCLAVAVGQPADAGAPRAPARPKDDRIILPRSTTPAPYDQVRVINEQVEAQWLANHIQPSKRCSNYEFIRRASLDIIGRIPTPQEIERFRADKWDRRKLIDRLLASEDYARNWANVWTVWLLTRSGAARYHEEMARWLEAQLLKDDFRYDKMVIDLLTAKGKSGDNGAVTYILSHMGLPNSPETVSEQGEFDFVPLTSRTTRLFLGIQTQCTQCHDHPFFPQQRRQAQFWGIDAYFRQVKGTPAMRVQQRRMAAPELTLSEDSNLNKEGEVFYEDRKATVHLAKPTWLFPDKDGRPIRANLDKPRRQQLAQLIVSSDYFPKAYVNRMWGHFFGRGFTNPGPVDDFGEHNPVTHPMLPADLLEKLRTATGKEREALDEELKKYDDDPDKPRLLDYLAEQFKKYQYNPKELIRWICNSEAYQLSSVANKTNLKADTEPFFSRMALKAMTPEQLFESLWLATHGRSRSGMDEAKARMRDEWMNQLIVNFGDDEGNEANFNGTVIQALMLMNGKNLNEAVAEHIKQLSTSRKRLGPAALLDHLYLVALSRLPTPKERALLNRELARAYGKDAGVALAQDVFWALLNSNEFMLNH